MSQLFPELGFYLLVKEDTYDPVNQVYEDTEVYYTGTGEFPEYERTTLDPGWKVERYLGKELSWERTINGTVKATPPDATE